MRPAVIVTVLLLLAAVVTACGGGSVDDIAAWHDRLETTVEGDYEPFGDDAEWFGDHLPERDDIASWSDIERSAAGRTWTVDTDQLATDVYRTREALQHADQHCDSRCPSNIHQHLTDQIEQLGHTLNSD